MTLIFSNHRFQYELERLFRNFFPPMELKLSTDRADAQGDYCLTEKQEIPGGVSSGEFLQPVCFCPLLPDKVQLLQLRVAFRQPGGGAAR